MSSKPPRFLQLDLLRAVAILLVLGRHHVVPPDAAGALAPVAATWERFGWTGVDLFFVLSGFLIGGLLFEELRDHGRFSFGRFLVRRGFKIWPSYYVFVAALFAASFGFEPLYPGESGTVASKLRDLVPHFLHVQNFHGPVWLHTWSLAVEEHFYFFFPLGLFLLTSFRRSAGPPPAWVVGLGTSIAVVGCTLLRVRGSHGTPVNLIEALVPTHLRIDGLLLGTGLAYVFHVRPAAWERLRAARWALFVVGLVAIAPMAFLELESVPFVSTWGFALLYLGYACILVAVMSVPEGSPALQAVARSVATRALLVVGLSSYSIYLWHFNFVRVPLQRLAAAHPVPGSPALHWAAYTALYVVAATGVGHVAGRLVEMPALRLRDRLFPRVAAARERGDAAAAPAAEAA